MNVNIDKNSYEIIIKQGILASIFNHLDDYNKIVIIKDDGVPDFYLDTLLKQKKCYTFSFKHGEDNKNFNTFLAIQEFLIANNFSRSDLLIALGGGVVGDLVGFVAATYKRGISYVQIPTTTLAQIDSSIGGKTAINHKDIKNIIGAFYQPKKVFIDIDVLKTLPKRHYNNGLVEALKMGLLFDKELFELFLKDNIENHIQEIIDRSLYLKKLIVEQDEKEKGPRKVLNFGHTIGHGLESYYFKNGKLHGECVAQGMLYCILNEEVKVKVKSILNKLEISIDNDFDIEKVVTYIKNDKKNFNDKYDLIILYDIGKYEIKQYTIEDIKNLIKKGI